MTTARRSFLTVFVFCLIFFLPSRVHAQNASVVLSVEPVHPSSATVNLSTDEFFTAKVNLQNPSSRSNIYLYSFVLTYDQRYIQLLPNDTVSPDKFPISFLNEHNGQSLRYSRLRFDDNGVNDDAQMSLATFRFKALRRTNSTRITLSSVYIQPFGQRDKLPVRIQNASYRITSSRSGTDTSSCSVCVGKTLCFCWFDPFR